MGCGCSNSTVFHASASPVVRNLVELPSSSYNLETFTLLWLDATVNSSNENRQAQTQMRTIINYLKVFEDVNQCEQYIRINNQPSQQSSLALVVSGSLAKGFLPKIHDLPQLITIYIYCHDKTFYEEWAGSYTKVKGIHILLNDLLLQLTNDQKKHEKQEDFMLSSMNLFELQKLEQTSMDLKSENAHFMWLQIFIEVLLSMDFSPNAKNELIHVCRQFYNGNEAEQKKIDEFDNTYSGPPSAIRWYTRDCCLYRMLNKALRVHDINVLFQFRFFIKDIYLQLKTSYDDYAAFQISRGKSVIHSYRGQAISKKEFERIKKSVDSYISVNSFFSTTSDRQQALGFTFGGVENDDLVNIIFEISADLRQESKPFADISSLSYIRDEREILFMLGSIFQIKHVFREEPSDVWVIQMNLCSENDHDLKDAFDHLKDQILCEQAQGLLSLALSLWAMGEYDKAETFYQRLISELPPNDPQLARCYEGIGGCADDKGEYDRALEYHEKALAERQKLYSSDHKDLGLSYNNIGLIHMAKGNYQKALESLRKAYEIWVKVYGMDGLKIGWYYANVALVYEKMEQYDLALNTQRLALSILEKHLPSNHSDIGITYREIASILCKKANYNESIANYEKSLSILTDFLPSTHPEIAITHEGIANVFFKQAKFENALFNYEKAYAIMQHSDLPSTHPTRIGINEKIDQTKSILEKRSGSISESCPDAYMQTFFDEI